MEKTFLILNILAIIICSYFFFMKINSYEKYLLTISIFFQLITIFSIFYKNFNYLIKYIDKLFVLTIIFGIFIIENFYLNFFVINLLFITLLTRNYYNKCLFYLKEKNKKKIFGDLGILFLLFIYLLKLYI